MSEKKILDRVRNTLRRKHYAYRTEQAYVSWIKRYIFFHNIKYPEDLTEHDIESFLTYLAVKRQVSPSTQNQALAALLFLYQELLGHADVKTTMIYTYVLNKRGRGVKRPLD